MSYRVAFGKSLASTTANNCTLSASKIADTAPTLATGNCTFIGKGIILAVGGEVVTDEPVVAHPWQAIRANANNAFNLLNRSNRIQHQSSWELFTWAIRLM